VKDGKMQTVKTLVFQKSISDGEKEVLKREHQINDTSI
jgi:hypothetical protein